MTLLCVDDDPEDVELFQDAVKIIDGNFTCIVASNGCEALRTLSSLVPDYIFLDINMPIMDGKETLMNIRGDKRFHAVPVCILSTSTNNREADICRRLGANRWMVKPNSFEELIAGLRVVLNG